MAKYKNISGTLQRFDLEGKEKIVDVDSRFTYNGPENSYLTGAVALGVYQLLDEPDTDTVPAKAPDSPLTNGK